MDSEHRDIEKGPQTDGMPPKIGGPGTDGAEHPLSSTSSTETKAINYGGPNGLHNEIDWKDYIVDFNGKDDPDHPHNWPMRKTLTTAIILGYTTLCSAWGSSVFSPGQAYVQAEFGISHEVATLSLSLYVLGFAFGPLLWGPLSENIGRKPPLIIGMLGFSIFQIAVAVAKDVQTVMLGRFFGGVFASCPLAVVGAAFADMFNQQWRGKAMTIFAAMVFMGPMAAPIVGGFIAKSYLGWRWTEYITAIMGFLALFLDLFFFSECYAPAILANKAKRLRKETGNWAWHAKLEEKTLTPRDMVRDLVGRPFYLLFREPIILLMTIYTAFVYGILYLFLTAYGYEFALIRHWELGVSSLPYVGLMVGEIIGCGIVLAFEPYYLRRCMAKGGKPDPEARLPPMIIGSVFFAAGLFWFGWTGKPSIHWIVPSLSGIFTGIGLMTIFLQAINYIIDTFLMVAATALAANTFLRSLFGAAFPLFALQMYQNLGVEWASSLCGFIAVALIPIPILFFFYGPRIRGMSKNAPKI